MKSTRETENNFAVISRRLHWDDFTDDLRTFQIFWLL